MKRRDPCIHDTETQTDVDEDNTKHEQRQLSTESKRNSDAALGGTPPWPSRIDQQSISNHRSEFAIEKGIPLSDDGPSIGPGV